MIVKSERVRKLDLLTLRYNSSCKQVVAPRVGAWIETAEPPASAKERSSRPAWTRGLKLLFGGCLIAPMCVALVAIWLMESSVELKKCLNNLALNVHNAFR